MKISLSIIAFLCLAVVSNRSSKTEIDPEVSKVLNAMYDSIDAVKTLQLKIIATERLGKTYSTARSEIKLITKPRNLYFINKEKKLEILYWEGKNDNKALIKYGKLPVFSLDPTGNMMRKNQHYTIHALGFDFIGKSIAMTFAKDPNGLKNMSYKGRFKKHNIVCHVLEYYNPKFLYVDYIIGKKETASSIASKLIVNDYLLRYRNDLLNDFGYLKEGKHLIVPNLYCKKALIFINARTYLPVSVSLYDDEGLFENYEYPETIHNQPLDESEFSRDNKKYHF
ncbi:MAG: DUF1571 domain-containing protein [Bacteroidia bacterium]